MSGYFRKLGGGGEWILPVFKSLSKKKDSTFRVNSKQVMTRGDVWY